MGWAGRYEVMRSVPPRGHKRTLVTSREWSVIRANVAIRREVEEGIIVAVTAIWTALDSDHVGLASSLGLSIGERGLTSVSMTLSRNSPDVLRAVPRTRPG
jgi:hypothetical protein